MKHAAMLLLALPLLAPAADPPAFDVKRDTPPGDKPDDRVTVTARGDAVVFDVTDPRGIGGVTIAPRAGTWPKAVVLKFHFRGLENLHLSNGTTRFTVSVLSHSGHLQLLSAEDNGKVRKVPATDPLFTEVRRLNRDGKPIDGLPDPKQGEYFEVAVPPALLDGKPSLEVHWIDFYR